MKRGIVFVHLVVLLFLIAKDVRAYENTAVSDNSVLTHTIDSSVRFLRFSGNKILGTDKPFGRGLGFSVGSGVQGILSFYRVGVLLPKIGGKTFINIYAKYMSSLTWATFINEEEEYVSFHPAVIGGAISIGGCSPMIHGIFKMYGGMDLFLGYSFTPYDSYIYKTGNLIGKNLTFALWGFFGFELFTSEHLAVFLDTGGGFKSLFGDEENLYVIASSWLGSGFGIKMGINYYF